MKAVERKNDIKLVIKGNGLKCKSEKKLKEIETLGDAIVALEKKRLNLKWFCTQSLNGLICLGFYKLLDLPYWFYFNKFSSWFISWFHYFNYPFQNICWIVFSQNSGS